VLSTFQRSQIRWHSGRRRERAPWRLNLDADLPIDLMVTDIIMPGLNGFNLAADGSTKRHSLRILYVTGYHEATVAMRDMGERLRETAQQPLLPCRFAKGG